MLVMLTGGAPHSQQTLCVWDEGSGQPPPPGFSPLHLGVSGDPGDKGPQTLPCSSAGGRSGLWLPTVTGCATHKTFLASHTSCPFPPPLPPPHLTFL